MMKRLYIENHTKPALGDVHFNSPPIVSKPALYIYPYQALSLLHSLLQHSHHHLHSSIMQQDSPSCNTMTNEDQVKLLHGRPSKARKRVEESCSKGSSSVSEALQKDSGRERLKRHREEVAGRVLIPDKWGNEELLKDWIDYSSFDSLLAPKGLASARKALMMEGRRNRSQRLRIESMC